MTIYYNEMDNTFTLTYNNIVVIGFDTYNEALEYYNQQIRGLA